MSTNWTSEEILYVLENQGTKTAREIAEDLKEMDFPNRTPSAVRGVTKRNITEENSLNIIENQPKILYFDIETTGFKADFAEVLMMGYRWHYEDKYHILKTNDYEGWEDLNIEDKDYYVLQDMFDVISEADVLVGHYSKRFDHTFIQSRCLYHRLPVIPRPAHVDTWHIARYQLALQRNSMKNIAKFLKCDDQKDSLDKWVWRRVNTYDEECIDMIAEYCIQDVKTQYAMTQVLLPLANHIPNMNILVDQVKYKCPGCGGGNIQKRGFHCTKVNKYQRFQCQDCGKWTRGRKTELSKNVERQMY
jgi:uncharacterized protein YprB with RNaseH-like and TPR domain/predicted RNA-binding Zn-ribbon protein involved in translation (DUF1610 family)